MTPYRVDFTAAARKEFDKLPKQIAVRLKPAILRLAENPRPPGAKKIVGKKDVYRLRVGDHRVMYEIRDKVLLVLVVKVGHRREVYR